MPQINIYAKPDAVLSGLPASGRVNNIIPVTVTTTNPNFSFVEEHGEFVYNPGELLITNVLYLGSTLTADVTLLSETASAELYWRSKNVWLGLNSNTQSILINPPGPDENAEVGFGLYGTTLANYQCVLSGFAGGTGTGFYVKTISDTGFEYMVSMQVGEDITWTQTTEAITRINNAYQFKIINRSTLEELIIVATSASVSAPADITIPSGSTVKKNRANACLTLGGGFGYVGIRINTTSKELPEGDYDLEVRRKPSMTLVNNPFYFTVAYT